MRLGLLADIHEHNHQLRFALDTLRRERVDQIIVLGDLFELGERIDETCRLLREAGAIGVWGNHDFGLCYEPQESTLRKYSATVLDYMASLRATLEIDGCLLTHVEPWLNPYDLADLWNLDGWPDTTERLALSFAGVANHVMIMGHVHRYFAATPAGLLDWQGDQEIVLDDGRRYLVGLAAVCDGKLAVYDTSTRLLSPLECRW